MFLVLSRVPHGMRERTATALTILLAVLLLSVPLSTALGHGGGTNAAGCHTNRKTGDYHCHAPKTPEVGHITYCHVVSGQYRCGYALSTCRDLVGMYDGYCTKQ